MRCSPLHTRWEGQQCVLSSSSCPCFQIAGPWELAYRTLFDLRSRCAILVNTVVIDAAALTMSCFASMPCSAGMLLFGSC